MSDLGAAAVVDSALARLREAADRVGAGWSPTQWRISDGSGPDVAWGNEASPESIGSLIHGLGDLDLDVGKQSILRTTLDVPEQLHGVNLRGDRLELTVWSIYPIELLADGTTLVAESVPPVALGPALLEVVDDIGARPAAQFEARIKPRDEQRGGSLTWLDFRFTTPCLRARFEALDLAWARLALARELASEPAHCAAVAAAAASIPYDLMVLDAVELESAVQAVASELATLTSLAETVDVHVIGHSHVDLAWLWTWDDAREVIKRDVRSVLSIMHDYPEATFTHSQPVGYDVVRREEPALFAEIKRLVEDGRWEPATAQWVEGDTNLASGEAMASQLLEGVSFTRRHLGVSPRLFFAPDTFGHSGNMPQLLAEAGVDVYLHARCNPGDPTGRRWPAYWWEGQDGTRVLACSPEGYNGTLTAGAIARAAISALRADLPAGLLFIGVGDHGGGPTRQGYDTLRRVGSANGMPRARCSTVVAFAEQLRSAPARLPVHRGESATIFEGCYTSHADAKQANRAGENRLMTAETVAVMSGSPRPADLDEAWRRLSFHQFHDVIGGAAVAEVYRHTRADGDWIESVADTVVARSITALSAGAPAGSIVVVNPHAHRCADVVTVDGVPPMRLPVLVDEAGRTTPGQVIGDGLTFVAEVDGFDVARYRLRDGEVHDGGSAPGAALNVDASDDRYVVVDTPHFCASIRRNCGILTSLIDKRCGRELVAFGMRRATDYSDTARPDLGLNVIQLVEELPHFMSAWQVHEVHAEYSLIEGADTEVIEQGPVRVVVQVTHHVRRSRIVEQLVFYRELSRIDLVIDVDWQEPGGDDHGVPHLKLSFAPDIEQAEAWFEAPFGAVRRHANGQQVPALRWVDVGGSDYGIAVLNDSTYGHDVLGPRIRASLVRTAYLPDPRSDHGDYVFRCSLVPHEADWRTAAIPQVAAAFNQPMLARCVDHDDARSNASAPETWPTIETTRGLTTGSLRHGRDGGVVVRIAECAGRTAQVVVGNLPDGSTVWASNLTEDRRGLISAAGPAATIELRPWQVRTVLVTR